MVEHSTPYSIAVGLDGSKSSWKAFEESLCIARSRNTTLHLVSIREEVEASYNATEVLAAEQTAQHRLEQIQIEARLKSETENVSVVTAILFGHSANKLVEYCKENHIDLLIIGETGHSSIWGALLGTSAEKIVKNAPCSVLLVR